MHNIINVYKYTYTYINNYKREHLIFYLYLHVIKYARVGIYLRNRPVCVCVYY